MEDLQKITKPVYALSGYAEWFWLMAKGIKLVENRNWSLNRYRRILGPVPVRIYLHASKTKAYREELFYILKNLEEDPLGEFLAVDFEKYRGHVIGEATILGEIADKKNLPDSSQICWFFGKYGFILNDCILYDNPIPCKGMLGFFKPVIEDIEKQKEFQLG